MLKDCIWDTKRTIAQQNNDFSPESMSVRGVSVNQCNWQPENKTKNILIRYLAAL